MPLLAAWVVTAGVGIGQAPPSKLAEAAAATLASTAPPVPHVMFEIRDLTATSPEWRGRMMAGLKPVARDEGVCVWTIEPETMRRLLNEPGVKVQQAPRLFARLGDDVRMSNEDEQHYVAHLDRVSDGPPNEGTRIAFQPVVEKIHDGVRVEVSKTQLKDSGFFAHVLVRQNKLLGFLTAGYTESVAPTETDPGVVKASFLSKLKPEGPEKASITGTIQVPEVASRRIEGDWRIPSEGALLVSMGPHSLGSKLGKKHYEERLILLSAFLKDGPPAESAPPKSP